MELTELLLYVLGFFLVIIFLRYVITAQNILGMALKNPEVKIVDRSACPGYLRDFYEIQEKEIIELGFQYQYCMFMDNIFVSEYAANRYVFVYYHQAEKTYATLSPSDTLDNYLPFRVVFRTYFKNGKKLMTYNCLKHALIGTLPDTILKDGYVETVAKQFDYHLKNLAEINEGEIKAFDEQLHPEEFIREEAGSNEKYLKKLAADGLIYPVNNDRYLVKTISSLRIAHQLISGLKKVNQLREKVKKSGRKVELPVELEVENYLTQKSTLNQKIRNKVGKTFFLLLSIVIFAAVLLLFVPPVFVAVLIGVVFLHECGHLLAMRLLGFKNLRMLFIPLFGAVAMGSDKGVAPHKKVVAFFAGPVPGIVLAFILLFLHFHMNISFLSVPTTITVIVLLLFINYLNLIPVLPFDGGQIFNTIIFSRLSVLQFIFNIISFIALVLLTIFLQAPLLLAVASLNLFGLMQYFQRKRFMAAFNTGHQDIFSLSEKDLLRKIFMRFRELPVKNYNSVRKFRTAQHIESSLTTRKVSKKTVFITIFFYIFLFSAPVLYLFTQRGLPFLPAGTAIKDPCKVVRETAKPVGISVVRSDFDRLDSKESKGSSLTSYRICFAYNDQEINTHPGDFLGRLWSLYGEPDDMENGFSYTLMEKKSGIIFTAHYQNGVPGYGSFKRDEQQVVPLLYRFEALLKQREPVDCSYAVKDRGGSREIGVENGDPYYDIYFDILESGRKEPVKLFALPEPVSLQVDELDKMLYVYTAFFAIGHDKWLASEASMVKTKVEVTGFPSGLSEWEQLELFPHIKEAINKKSPFFKRLKRPRAGMMVSGVYPDPENNRLLLLQGATYTQEGGWGLVNLLKESPADLLTAAVELEFFPGDYEKAPDLPDFFLCFKGKISGEHMEVHQVSGIVDSPGKINALLQAARLFTEFEAAAKQEEFRYSLADEEEARKVKELYIKVAGREGEIEAQGKEIIAKNHRAYDLGLVLAFYRYGQRLFL